MPDPKPYEMPPQERRWLNWRRLLMGMPTLDQEKAIDRIKQLEAENAELQTRLDLAYDEMQYGENS